MNRNWTIGPNPARSAAGYTLVEVLIALALVALLSAGLVSGISSGTRIWERANQVSVATSISSITETVVRRHLSMIVPVAGTDSNGSAGLLFKGSAKRLEFLTGARVGPLPNGVYAVVMEIEEEEVDVLVVRRTVRPVAALADGSVPEWVEERIRLLESGAKFTFFQRAVGPRPAEWRDDWVNERQLPDLIGLTYAQGIANADEAALLVAPKIDQGLGRLDQAAMAQIFRSGGG